MFILLNFLQIMRRWATSDAIWLACLAASCGFWDRVLAVWMQDCPAKFCMPCENGWPTMLHVF
jgi:hypothetical protein